MPDLREQLVRAGNQVAPVDWASPRELRSVGHRRVVRRRALVGAGVAAAAVVAWVLWPGLTVHRSQPTAPPQVPVCAHDTCPGGSPLRVVGPPVPFVWTLPSAWEQQYKAGSTYEDVTAQTKDGSASFVFMEDVVASDPRIESSAPTDPPAAPGAQALASWLASRPYLRVTSQPRATEVGGQPAWEMDVRIGTLEKNPTTMVSGLPGAYLVRVQPPVSDLDTMAAWFDSSYTTPTQVWLVDLPNGTVGYVEGGSPTDAHEPDIVQILTTMRFDGT
jgi:hypothetical protein